MLTGMVITPNRRRDAVTDAEYKLTAIACANLVSAQMHLSNVKSDAGKASTQASMHYKEHKKAQPSWKLVAASLE